MAINKLYAKRMKSTTETTAKGTAKVVTTYHATYEEVVKMVRGAERISKVGTGEAVKVDKSPALIAKGVYVNVDTMTADELHHLKSDTNVRRMVNPRYIATVKQIRHLINSIKNPLVTINEQIGQNICSGLALELQELERVITKGKKEKETIQGII